LYVSKVQLLTGTTWTQEMAWLLLNDLDYETAKNVLQTERSPFLE